MQAAEVLKEEQHQQAKEYEMEDAEDEEEEPLLKYQKLDGDGISLAITGDQITASTATSKIIIIGTSLGRVLVLDLKGNKIAESDAQTAAITKVAADAKSVVFASCANNGKIVFASVSTPSTSTTYTPSNSVQTFALSPDYQSTNEFAYANNLGQLINVSRGWLGQKETIVFNSDKPILDLLWVSKWILWITKEACHIFDTTTQQLLPDIPLPPLLDPTHDSSPVFTFDGSKILISHGTSVSIICPSQAPSPNFELQSLFFLSDPVCGLAPFHSQLFILQLPTGQPPEIAVTSIYGTTRSNDVIPLDGYQNFTPATLKLNYVSLEDDTYYLVSPNSILSIRPKTPEERVAWLKDQGRFEAAFHVSKENLLPKSERMLLGYAYLDSLYADGRFDDVVEKLGEILGAESDKWEEWVRRFLNQGKISTICGILHKGMQLSEPLVTQVFLRLIHDDPKALRGLVRIWGKSGFDCNEILSGLEKILEGCREGEDDAKTGYLRESAVELYGFVGNYSCLLLQSLRLHLSNSIALIERFDLHSYMTTSEFLSALFDFDEWLLEHDAVVERGISEAMGEQSSFAAAITPVGIIYGDATQARIRRLMCLDGVLFLTQNTEKIPPSAVVSTLTTENRHSRLFIYLAVLVSTHPAYTPKYASMVLPLLIEYDRPSLMMTLKTWSGYDFNQAYRLCEDRGFVEEKVWILTQMGNVEKALDVLMDEIGDVDRTLEFLKTRGDDVLWRGFLERSRVRPAFIVAVLSSGISSGLGYFGSSGRGSESGKGRWDMIDFIRKIPTDLDVPQLKQALTNLLQDANALTGLKEQSARIGVEDVMGLLEQYLRQERRGTVVEYVNGLGGCSSCGEGLEDNTSSHLGVFPEKTGAWSHQNVILFFCGHRFHAACLGSLVSPGTERALQTAKGKGGLGLTCPLCGDVPGLRSPPRKALKQKSANALV